MTTALQMVTESVTYLHVHSAGVREIEDVLYANKVIMGYNDLHFTGTLASPDAYRIPDCILMYSGTFNGDPHHRIVMWVHL